MNKEKFFFILKLVFSGCALSFISALLVMRLVVSVGSIIMPDYTGQDLDQVKKSASRMGLELKIEDQVFSNLYEAGKIVSQNIKPKVTIKKGRVVYVVVSKGSKVVVVPDISGQPKAKAVLTLKNIDLDEGLDTDIASPMYKENTIIAQSPQPGDTVPFNYRINLLRSSGPKNDYFMMPDLKGRDLYSVYKSLRKENLLIDKINVEVDNSIESGTILSQIPLAGYTVNSKLPITLTASKKDNDLKLKKRLIRITYKIEGEDPVPKHVKINVLSLAGSEAVYDKITSPQEEVDVQAGVRGDALVQIYVGNELEKEREFPAGGATE
jgi:serine/threonine-protein kinase